MQGNKNGEKNGVVAKKVKNSGETVAKKINSSKTVTAL
jgi:hypothetical protein